MGRPKHPTHVHDDACLKEAAAVHVSYELNTLAHMAQAQALDLLTATPIVECTFVHLRSMSEFLADSNNGGWEHRVVAVDFFDVKPADTWTVFQDSEGVKRRISRKVSHIYCDRADEDLDWPSPQVLQEWIIRLFEGVEVFLRDLAAVHPDRAAWFSAGWDLAREAVAAGTRGELVFGRVAPRDFPKYGDGRWIEARVWVESHEAYLRRVYG